MNKAVIHKVVTFTAVTAVTIFLKPSKPLRLIPTFIAKTAVVDVADLSTY